MTPQRYIADRQAEGAKLTHIVGELADITGANTRTVWRWVKGECTPTNSALRLIQLWYTTGGQITPKR
jgi:DNA-binding transcriptional regulator YiaG